MQKLKTFLTVIGAVTILVLAANSAVYAATGGKFILGQTNKANKMSTLQRTTGGTALKVVTNSSSNAPLATNGRGKVANLNADLLDGLDSTALMNTTRVYTKHQTVGDTEMIMTAPVAAGTYQFSYSAFFNSSPSTALGSVDCFMHAHNGSTTTAYAGEEYFSTTGDDAAISGSGVIVKPAGAGAYLQLECYADVPFIEWGSTEPYQLTLTKVDSAPSSSLARTTGGARLAK